jgi:hypothetical protein
VDNAFALSKLCGAQSVMATAFARRQRFDAVPSITLPQHAEAERVNDFETAGFRI